MPDSQTLGLLIAAMVAGVICFRLYTILGRRTGHEPPPQAAPSPLTPAPLPRPAQDRPAPSSDGLLNIQRADPRFNASQFLAGAREAYARIVTAFAKGDRTELRLLLSPDVYSAFDAGIANRSEPPPAFVKLQDARIVSAALEGRQAEVTVAFAAEFANEKITDVWTFERNLDSSDPNWLLVATSGDAPE